MDILKDVEDVLMEMRKKPWKNMILHEAVRTALVAYNAVFDDLGDLSKKEYLIKIVKDAITMTGLR